MLRFLITTILFFSFFLNVNAQIDSNSVFGLPSTATLTNLTSLTGFDKGNLAYVEDVDQIYMFNGTSWIIVTNENTNDKIDNELFFEDTNYYYVSVLINTTDWMVTRYDRSNINTEANAMGTGTQPADLTTVAALPY